MPFVITLNNHWPLWIVNGINLYSNLYKFYNNVIVSIYKRKYCDMPIGMAN